MKQIIVAAAILLSACNQVPQTEQPDPWPPAAEDLYKSLVAGGWSPVRARAHVEAALADRDHNSGRNAGKIAKQQGELADVRSDACKNDPDLSYC